MPLFKKGDRIKIVRHGTVVSSGDRGYITYLCDRPPRDPLPPLTLNTRELDEITLISPAPEEGFIYQWTESGSKYIRVRDGWFYLVNGLFYSDALHPRMMNVPKRKLEREEG